MISSRDINHMRSTLALARRGLGRVWPNPSVGCIVVNKDGYVVGRGVTSDGGRPHAETQALRQAGIEARGGCVYVSLEPCAHHGQTPPCTGFLIESGVKHVFIACQDPDPRVSGKGIRQLRAAGIDVDVGVLEQEAQEINRGFMLKMIKGRPLVTIKTATSGDGKIAAEKGKRTQILGSIAMRRVHLERSRHDAILVGIGTVLADDPLLTTRLPGHEHNIVRVILDSGLRTPLDSRLVKSALMHPLWIIHQEGDGSALKEAGAILFQTKTKDPEEVLQLLAQQGVTRLLIEGGAKVNTAFLEAGLCDHFLHFSAVDDIGENGLNALEGRNILCIEHDFDLKKRKVLAVGEDLLEIHVRNT